MIFLSQIFYEAGAVVFDKRGVFGRVFEAKFKVARLDFVAGEAVGVAALVLVFELAVVSAARARGVFCNFVRAVNGRHERRVAEIRRARGFYFFYRRYAIFKTEIQKLCRQGAACQSAA